MVVSTWRRALLPNFTDCSVQARILVVTLAGTESEYDRTSTKTDSATLYDNKSGESGAELAGAFRKVVKQIKDNTAGDIQNGKVRIR